MCVILGTSLHKQNEIVRQSYRAQSTERSGQRYLRSLEVREAVSSDNTLGGNTTDGNHSETSVQQLAVLLLLKLGGILGGKCGPSEVTGFTFSLHSGRGCGSSDNHIPETDPEQELVHRATFQESIVGIDSLGDGLEGVGFPRDSDEILNDESNDGKHGGTSVSDLGLTEPRQKGLERSSQSQGVELEFLATEVDATAHLVDGGRQGGALGYIRSGSESSRRSDQGSNDSGLHGCVYTMANEENVVVVS